MTAPEEKAFEEIKAAVENGVTDREFWHSRTPDERILAMELMRQRAYGYDQHTVPKFQYVIEVVNLKDDSHRSEQAKNPADISTDPA